MKIAVSYADGQVFQHFGKTEAFKIYEIQDGQVLGAQVVPTDGNGHEALAQFLAQLDVAAVICGGMGEGAQSALLEAGIQVFSGAQGDADEAIDALLAGQLEGAGVTCDHHDSDEGCGGDCGCGGSCGGGCGGGCHGRTLLPGKNSGKTVRVHYRGTLNDGSQFDSSYDRGEPLEFVCGAGQMIRGFDLAVLEMEVGQEVDIHLLPEEAYGPADPRAIFTVEIAQLPGSEELSVGERVYLYNNMGQPFPVTVTAKDDATITFDANHEMAGKELNFHIQLVEVL